MIYLDGNSLGALPKATSERVRQVVEGEWGEGLIRSWNDADWIEAPARVGAKLAGLVGARPHEVVVADSTSVNLFKLLHAALRARAGRRTILYEAGDFPTDGYIAQGLTDADARGVAREELANAIDETTAVVLLSAVHYKTAARWDMAELTRRAHEAGALILWDLSHAAGAVEIDLNGCGADLAVGCGYKFLNGGPGAPAFLFVAESLQESLRSPLTGWMGHAAPFAFEGGYRAGEGVSRFLCGTPPILSMAALEAGVDLALEAPIASLATKSAALFDVLPYTDRGAVRLVQFPSDHTDQAEAARQPHRLCPPRRLRDHARLDRPGRDRRLPRARMFFASA